MVITRNIAVPPVPHIYPMRFPYFLAILIQNGAEHTLESRKANNAINISTSSTFTTY